MQHFFHRDPHVAAVVELCANTLTDPKITQGNANPATLGPMPVEARQLHAIAVCLCEEEEFEQALAPAMVLALWHPGDPRYAFIAGACLQRTEKHAAALMMFGNAGLGGGEEFLPAVAFRSGECLAAMGHADEAIRSFDAAIEASRREPGLAELQQLAQE